MKIEVPKELAEVIKAGIKANREVPGSVAVGGSVCSLFTHHRESTDIDFVITDLSRRFESVREHLLELPEWKESRVHVPVLILGSLQGIEIGFRQLRRSIPLETQIIETPDGKLVVPTIEELLRIKAFLTYNRNATRDFVDFAELSVLFEIHEVGEILIDLDERFSWEKQPSIIVEVAKKLLLPSPFDLDDSKSGFAQLRFIDPRLKTWKEVAVQCKAVGENLTLRLFAEKPNDTPASDN